MLSRLVHAIEVPMAQGPGCPSLDAPLAVAAELYADWDPLPVLCLPLQYNAHYLRHTAHC